jgi:molybdopterin molybdotransferase
MLAYEDALHQLLDALVPLPRETLSLADAVRSSSPRYLAEFLFSPAPLPAVDNSSMDGYAVRSSDTRPPRAKIEVIGELAAGTPAALPVGPGQAIRIFTGAPLPPGADAVLQQEDAIELPGPPRRIAVLDPVKPWENVRLAGEDVREGDPLSFPGMHLSLGQIALLSALGWTEVTVTAAPRVALIATGSELIPAGEPLRPGKLYESNRLPLQALVQSAGGRVVSSVLVPDDPAATVAALEHAASVADVILSIGGASVGEHDLVKSAALTAGFSLDFWKLALKPGKPFFKGHRGTVHLLGVPGNPVSAFVTTVLLVQPALRRLAGAREVGPPIILAELAQPLSNPDGRRHFMRVCWDLQGRIKSAGLQASHRLASLAVAGGLVDVPPHTDLRGGSRVRVIHWGGTA